MNTAHALHDRDVEYSFDSLLNRRRRLLDQVRELDDLIVQNRPSTLKPLRPAWGGARPSPLDHVREVVEATTDLREENGNLNASRVAELFGVSLSQLAGWLGKSRQAVTKTPDADSLQEALGYFERVARLRGVAGDDAAFRKWLRMPNDTLANRAPLDLLKTGHWQALADKVDDMLTGMPT